MSNYNDSKLLNFPLWVTGMADIKRITTYKTKKVKVEHSYLKESAGLFQVGGFVSNKIEPSKCNHR